MLSSQVHPQSRSSSFQLYFDDEYSLEACFILFKQYYKYTLETPYALTGTHNLAKATAKGSTVVLFVASANDRQWQTSEKVLRTMLDSFKL